jgi:hypothetical protein
MTLRTAYLLAPAMALLLSACAPGTGVGSGATGGAALPSGSSLEARWERRVVTLLVAERIADACYGEGIYLAPSPYGGAVHRATEEMVAAGEDRAALDAVFATHDFNSTTTAVERYLASRGGSVEAPASLCAVGEAEIAEGSEVGRVLTRL